MRKHWIFSLTALLTLSTSCLQAWDSFLEAKAAYFYPTDDKFRSIYNSRGIYGLEYTCQAWKWLYPWISTSYYSSWGKSMGFGYRTHIYFIPIGLGLKYLHSFKHADLYAGVGGLATYVHIRNHSPFVVPTTAKWGGGAIAKVGLLINLPKSFLIDIFSDYSYMKVDTRKSDHGKVIRHHVDLSGWSIGGAIGYRFGTRKQSKSTKNLPKSSRQTKTKLLRYNGCSW